MIQKYIIEITDRYKIENKFSRRLVSNYIFFQKFENIQKYIIEITDQYKIENKFSRKLVSNYIFFQKFDDPKIYNRNHGSI